MESEIRVEIPDLEDVLRLPLPGDAEESQTPPSPSSITPPTTTTSTVTTTSSSSSSSSSSHGDDPHLFSEMEPPSSPSPPLIETPIRSFFSPFSFSSETKSTMMGAGLLNLGNTCFLNAILQCFTHTVPFVLGLRSCVHPTPCHRSNQGFCLLCALRDQIELSLSSSGRMISPDKLVNNLSHLSSSFRRYEQEDAHEFLQCLLDRLDSCCADGKLNDESSYGQQDSFVKNVFGGRLKSKLQCSNCGHSSDTFEPLIDLSLEIEDVDSLPSALQSFTKVEKIEETKFTCDNCKENVLVEKQFTLEQTPAVAAFHLKRFKHDGSYIEKIDKYVEYPLELDLQPYSSNQENDNVELKYELYAVVVHTGLSSCSGHYFCFIRSSPQTWHRLDDSRVTRVSEEFVLSQEAYILFYAKQGTPWFSTIMETQKQLVITSPKSVLDDVDARPTIPLQASYIRDNISIVRNDADKIPNCSSHTVDETHFSDINRIHEGKIPCVVPLDKFKEELGKASESVDVRPHTPPRSPSPDIYSKDPPEDSYSIPRDHLKVRNQTPSNKAANTVLDDSKKREALKLTRSMPTSRAMKLRACMLGAQSEGSINKKKRKAYSGFGGDKRSPSGACRKLNPSILSTLPDFC